MSGKTENYHRNAIVQKDDSNDDFEYFITSDLPEEQIRNALKIKNMSEKEIDNVVEKVKESRDNLNRIVRKFIAKVDASYRDLEIPELLKKGIKHAEKAKLTEAQKKVFLKHVLRRDTLGSFSYRNELKYTPMAKFFGFDFVHGQMIKVPANDMSKLNELHMLYTQSLALHAHVKSSLANYRDCAPEAITGKYDSTKHNVNIAIHPVIASLFFPKVDYLERRMLYTNIARMVLSRARAYLGSKFELQTDTSNTEVDAELELAHDIAFDPNALDYFREDSPLDNILKRFRAQIELYKTVLNLRQGRYYSTGYDENDGVSGLLRVLNSYDWTFFDSPDLYNVQDEGTILRKLLAIFSCRPTFTQLTSYANSMSLTPYANAAGMSKTVFVNIPVINIRLPMDLINNQTHAVSLSEALSQLDYFIEHKTVVPKNKSIIYSNQVAFFYANRRYPSVNFNTTQMTLRYMSLPMTVVNQTTINKSIINFDNRMRIGRDWFNLRSVVVLQRPPLNDTNIATGCSAMIVVDPKSPTNMYQSSGAPVYIHYNPSIASIMYYDGNQPQQQSQYVANTPVSYIDEYTTDPSRIGFRNEAQERGTVFFYVKE